MATYLEMLRQQISNEKGAEIVEWVLWVGGIAILAGTLYGVVSGALTNTITNIVGGITGVTGS
jgi:Flp pilus assembly pilin Flp